MLYDYEEHGPENLVATLDRRKLPAMLEKGWGFHTMTSKALLDPKDSTYTDSERNRHHERIRIFADEQSAALVVLLSKLDKEIQGSNQLMPGWGGVCLHVIELR